jgi:hypothetical protein
MREDADRRTPQLGQLPPPNQARVGATDANEADSLPNGKLRGRPSSLNLLFAAAIKPHPAGGSVPGHVPPPKPRTPVKQSPKKKTYPQDHLQHRGPSSVLNPTWLTARLTGFAFRGCDDEHPQAHRRIGVRLPDPAGRGVGRHREGPSRAGLLLHRTGRNSGSLDRRWPGRHRRAERWGCGEGGADVGAVRRRHASPRHPAAGAARGR